MTRCVDPVVVRGANSIDDDQQVRLHSPGRASVIRCLFVGGFFVDGSTSDRDLSRSRRASPEQQRPANRAEQGEQFRFRPTIHDPSQAELFELPAVVARRTVLSRSWFVALMVVARTRLNKPMCWSLLCRACGIRHPPMQPRASGTIRGESAVEHTCSTAERHLRIAQPDDAVGGRGVDVGPTQPSSDCATRPHADCSVGYASIL